MSTTYQQFLSFAALLILTISQVLSQEICTNGIDDDGDGFIDCYDGECSGGPSCADFFYGNPIVCKDEPTENPTFAMKLQWGSEDRSADSHATPAVGDLDNDGLPEVVVINRLDERLFILNGEDGSTAFTYDLGYQPENGIVLANLDGGDCANIYISRDNSTTITALDCEANFLWESNASDRVGIMGIADFNGDGNSELYYKTEIMDAATGNILVTGTNDNWVQKYAHSAIAVDILDDSECADCSGLELITGNQIWAINIGAGTRTLARDLNDLFAAEIPTNNKRYYTKYFNTTQNRTCISVADYNQDGHVDVLMPGAYGSSNSSQTTIFFWDVFNSSYLVYDGGVNHNKGTGRLNVSDIDGDGLMNTTYVSDQILYALDENLGVLWTKGIDEGSSGFTGTTVFDFDGDGAAETIYRSEYYLYIINGTDGSTRTTIPCKSRTQEEYPLVADVDNDGSSELCVPCYTSNNTNFSPYSNTRYSQIRIYEADGGEIWQPSRRVWNQHGYYVVNVNDDLTIPAEQQDHTAIFGTTDCQTGATIENRALNGFLNQTTFLESDGCPSYVSPDVNLAGNISATPSQCPLNAFEVTFDIENTGDTDIYGTLPVTFYNGDPETSGATKLNTEFWNFNSTPLLEGATETLTFTVEGSGGDFDLYISLNNNGQNPPINLAGGGFPECDFTNNIGNVSVTYQTFTLTANKLEDNRKCDASKPDNGEAEAYFEGTLGGELETIWSEDFTGLSNGTRSDAGTTAWTSSKGSFNPLYWGVNTKSGNKVYRTRKTGQNNEVSEVTWLSEEIDISGHTDIAVTLDMLTNNTLEASGNGRDYMRAFYILDGGAETEFDTNGELYGSFLYALAEQTGLNGSTLQIKVTFHTTGNGEYQYLDNVSVTGTSIPVTQVYTDADGFEFYWYNTGDYSSPVASGSLNTGMATGTYDVVGFYPASNCYSDTLSITINDSIPTFDVWIYETNAYTDCVNPDGALASFVYTQEDGSGNPLDTLVSGYSFSWFETSEGLTPIGTGNTISSLSGVSYTVRVEQLITGCPGANSLAPFNGLVTPADPTVNKTDISACSGPGSTGSADASVGGVTTDYTFNWFYENVDGSPEYTGSSISGLLAGTYFVRAIDNGSSCQSSLTTFEILDNSGDPTPNATQVQADNGCNTNNGIATADGDGAGTTAGYTFEWFAGNNTLSANQLPTALAGSSLSPDGATASGLSPGLYTVRATIAGCSSTDTVRIEDEEVIPTYNIVNQVDAGNALQVLGKAIVNMPQLISGTSEFTVSYWVEISSDNYVNDHRIFSSGGKNESQMMLWTSDEFGISFVIKADGDSDVGKINTFYKPTGWVQLTGTWNEATGEMKLYANGVKIGEATYFGDDPTILEGVVDNGPDMYIAGDGNFGVNKFEGRIDEVKIYNRALDETEILTELCDPAGGSTSGLLVHYNFNDIGLNTTQGSTVPDVSGNGNDGTLAKPGAGSPGSWDYVTSGIQCPLAGMVNNTSCDPANPNGEIDLTGAVDPIGANYEYTVYEGTEVDPDTTIIVNTTGIFSNLQDGFYTIVTTDVDSDCSTDPLTLAIATLSEQPSIITDITDNTGCTIGAGEILATSSSVSGEPASYTYELYDGWGYATLLETETVADGSTGFNFTGLTTGEYRIRVINDDILCEDFVDVYVDDASTNPSFNDGSTIINHNTVCSGTPNGFTSVAVNGGNSDYTFEWYDGGSVVLANLRSETDEFLDEISAGQYTVVATSTITGCPTPPKVITIYDQPVYPSITTQVVAEQTACDFGNGTLYAFVTEPGGSDCVECTEPDDYGFQWYLGTDTSTPLVEGANPGNGSIPADVDSSVVSGLAADDYTVVVTNLTTGCTDTTYATISYDPMPPTINPVNSTITDNTSCVDANGAIVASVDYAGETINGAVNDQPWQVITDCNTETDLNSSILPNGGIELTPDVNNQAGKAYLGDSVDFSAPTRIDFWMYLGDKDNGADGITFIFHQDPDGKDALGEYGCNLGIGDESCYTSAGEDAIAPSVAVEFDTYNNGGGTKDPSYDHTAFVINGEMNLPQGDVGVFYNADQPQIVNGQNDVETDDSLRVTVTIDPNLDGTQTMSVYVEDELRLQRTQDFVTDIFGGNPKTIAGFTASTGGARNQQWVRIDPYFGEYEFAWYEGGTDNEANRIAGVSSPYLCGLAAGDYTYKVTYNGTGCESAPATFTVNDATDTAIVSVTGIENTVCDPALALSGDYNGSLTANVAGNPADYTYEWYEGTTASGPVIATTQTLSNITGGDYTIRVETIVGGCVRVRDTTLADATVDPAILDVDTDVTVQNVTACEGGPQYPNGSITINSVSGTGPYGYMYWFGTDTTSGTFLTDGSDIFTQTSTSGTASVNVNGNGTASITGLSAGDYTIIVIDSASGCTSSEANVEIIDEPTIPDFDQSITNNTVCDITLNSSGNYDGEVQVDPQDGSNVSDYVYTWYDGTGTSTPTSYTATNNILSEAPDGNYTVVISSNVTGCDTTIYATIGDGTVDPAYTTIAAISITDMSVCAGGTVYPNGGLTINEGQITGSGDYTHLFYFGASAVGANQLFDGDNIVDEKTGTPAGVDISIAGTSILNIDTGFYTVVTIDNVTGCLTNEQTVEVQDAIIDINVAPTIIHYTNCDAPNGEITVVPTMASGSEPSSYSYQWYYGSGTSDALDASDLTDGTALSGTATANVSGLEDGTYTVEITNDDTGCSTIEEYDVEDNRVYPVITPSSIVVTDNQFCSSPGNGEIDPTGAVSVAGPYLFTLYDATDAVITTSTTTFTGLDAGNYKVGVELTNTGCVSVATVGVVVEDDITNPSININSLVNETSCISPNGQIILNSPGGADPIGGWDVNIYQGSGTGTLQEALLSGGGSGSFNLSSSANLDNGLYTIQVINNETGCDSLREVTILEVPNAPTLNSASKTNDTYCTSDNGTITITSVTNAGASPTYNLYFGSTVTGTPDATSSTTTFSSLAAGTYTVSVTHGTSGCESNGLTRTINSVPTTVTGNVSLVSDQTSCDLSDPNGQLTANPTAPTADPADFTFEWFQGQNTNSANAIPASVLTSATLSGTNGQTITGLPAGTYRVRITDNESGCFVTVDRSIILSTTDPVVGGISSPQDNTSCATPDGQVSITVNDGGSGAINDGANGYTFELFEGTSISPSDTPIQTINNTTPSPTTQVFTGLLDGDYIVRATDNNTNCKVISTPVTVNYSGITATFDESLFFKQAISACFDEDGIIDVGETNAPGAVSLGGTHSGPINITWYAGTDTSIVANQVSNLHNISGLSSPVVFSDVTVSGVTITNGRMEGLPAISYTGVVELSNGCIQLINTNLTLGSAPDVVTSVSTPVTRCAATYDGEIDVTMDVLPLNTPNQYNWYVFEGAQQILPDADGSTPFNPDLTTYGPIADNGSFTSAVNGGIETITATGLAAGLYTIGIEFAADGCITHVSTITIDEPEYPELSTTSIINNNVCDVSGALDYNGAISVSAIHNTLGGTFDFAWYYDIDGDGDFTGGDQTAIVNGADGAGTGSNVTGATTPDSNTAGLSGIGPGWYRVIAIHNDGGSIPPATACPDTLDIQVFDELVDVTATAGVDYTFNDQGDCDGFGDFTLTQVVQSIGGSSTTNGTVAADYTITWTKDGGAFTPDSEVSDADLLPGDYSLELIQDTTGCSTTIDFTIEDVTVDPIIELVNISDNTTCTGGANLPTGVIEVRLIDDNGNPVAILGEYDIQWYENAGLTVDLGTTVGVEAGADNEQATQLPAGTYYVEVTDINATNDNNACVASASYTVIDNPADVSIQATQGTDYTIQHQTDCTPVNGAISLLNVYEDGVADAVSNGNYQFSWFADASGTALGVGSISGTYNENIADLPAGNYFVAAQNQSTDCISDTISFTIQDKRIIPSVQVAQLLPDTTCVGSTIPSGEIEASAILSGGATGDPNNFTYTWYEGGAVDPNFSLNGPGASVTIAGYAIGGTNGENVSGLPAGQYTVSIEDDVTPGDGCTATATITVTRWQPTLSIPNVDITVVDNSDCSADNGSATVDAITLTKFGGGTYKVNSGDPEFADYDIRWYDAPTGGGTLSLTNVLDPIGEGTYYIEVSNSVTSCAMPTGVRKAVTVDDISTIPLIQLVSKTSDLYCSPTVANEGNGSLIMKVVHESLDPADSTDYTITWYRGTGTGTTLASAPGSSTVSPNGTVLTGLSAGTYTVTVSKNGTPNDGCSAQKTFTIIRDEPTYALPLSAMTISNNFNCSNPNGSITLDGIYIDGVFEDFSTTADNYTINWTSLPGGVTVNTVNFANDQITGLEGGTYEVDVTNDRTNCTVSANILIDDITSDPLVQLVIKSADEYCDNTGFQGNGSLEMKIIHEGNNPADPLDYNIQWFRGTGTGTTLASTMGSAVIGGNGTQLSGLATGTYTVVVTKNGAPNDQCFKQVTFSIVRDAPNFSIQTTSVAVTDNTNCNNPNGVIEITNVIVDGTVVDLSTTPDNYSFSWPDGFGGGTPGANNFPNDIATDLPAGTYRIVASNVTTGCSTDTIAVVVDDVPTQPALSFIVDNPNQNCGVTKNGQLTVTATTADGNPVTNVGRYNFTWYDGKGTSTATTGVQTDGTGASDNTSTLSALDSGYYTVEVFDNTNFCTVTGSFFVNQMLDNPQLLKADIVVRADTTCTAGGSGTIIVADTSFQSGVLDDYNVEIRSGSVTGPILTQSTAGFGNTDLTISTLDPGTYYITATRAATECETAPVQVNILDERFPPDIVLDSLIANPNCGGTIALGSVITTADGFDETNTDYIFQWYEGTVGGGLLVPAGNGGNTATIFDMAEGQYELEVTNLNTGCVSTQIFDIPAIQVNPRISSYGVSNNLLCSTPGSGSFEINQVTFNGTFYDQGLTADSTLMVSDFTYEFFESDQTTPLVDSEPATPLEMNGLSAGTYYVRVRRNDSQCSSGFIQFDIQDLPQYPVIELFQIEADSTCNGLNPNGTIAPIVDGVVNDTLYTYDWYEVDASGTRISGSLSNNDTINGLAAGRYELEVLGLSTGCSSTRQINVINAPVEVEILAATTTDPTTCSPANGIIEITSITPGILTDYTFDFFLGDPANGGVNVQSALGAVYASGAPGVYYIQATHNVYGCVNNLYEVELEDNLVYPDIELVSFANQTNCDPGNPNGSLSATADGSTDNVAYNFEWRDELDNIIEPNNASVSNLAEGTYTLTVTDNSTGCMISQSFDIADEIIQPFITTSTQPNTNCVDPNGVMNATVSNTATIGKPLNVYSFYWFNGHITDIGLIDTTNAVYTGTQVTDLLDGDYTVYVIDNTDAYCESFKTLTIQDGTFPPPFEIEVQNDVTICYDSLPNGRARIAPGSLEANRELFEFSYEWFEGTSADTAGQTPFVTGIRADSLTIGTYSVLATDLRTGCENLVTFNIIDDTEPVPGPSVNVVSDRDNCQFANGHAVASIGGTITGYRFDWYLASGDTSTVQFTGHEIFTLDSISYTVQATRLSTGCVSPRMPVDIINAIVDPEFEVKTTTSLCLRTEDGAFNQFTGTAEIIFSTFAVIDYIEWIGPDGTIYSNDIKLVNAEPGLWTVNFIAGNGCSYTADFSIQTALKIYNGVSANADGRNDYFFVDCIDYFPNNNVQIFNRDGTRVWEADGYDNASVRFEGFSNVGRAGLQLPTGTYFYIIEKGAQVGEVEDKTNRAKIQGYLELVR